MINYQAERFQVWAARSYRRIEIYWASNTNSEYIKPVSFDIGKLEDTSLHDPEPAFQFTAQFAQQLMDAFYQVGIRPSTFVDEASRVPPMQAHINDLRAILFHKEGIDDKSNIDKGRI